MPLALYDLYYVGAQETPPQPNSQILINVTHNTVDSIV